MQDQEQPQHEAQPVKAELVPAGQEHSTDITQPPSFSEFESIRNQAALMAKTGLVPEHFQNKPDDIVVVILTGRELGIPPMRALQEIHVIKGKPGLNARLMMALVQRAGHDIWIDPQSDAKSATCHGKRKGTSRVESFTFTWEDAKTAQLLNQKGQMYEKYPKAMLMARAISGLCRMTFSDVVTFGYTPEELETADSPGIEMARTPLLPPAEPGQLAGVHPEWIERELAHHTAAEILQAAKPWWRADRPLASLHELHEVPLEARVGIAEALKEMRGEPTHEQVIEEDPVPPPDPVKGGCSQHPDEADPECEGCQWVLGGSAAVPAEEVAAEAADVEQVQQEALLGVPESRE